MKEPFPTREAGCTLYFDELSEAMAWLGKQDDTVFLGQSVCYKGNAIFKTLSDVPMEKRIEMPVAEDMQMGMSIGMAMAGKVPISIYPRFDFLLCAVNQLVNHLDKGIYPGKVIIRTCVGATKPMHPGVQHCGDYSDGLEKMLKHVSVIQLTHPLDIMPAYLGAYASSRSTVLVEYGDLYNE